MDRVRGEASIRESQVSALASDVAPVANVGPACETVCMAPATSHLDRIIVDPEIVHGKPVIRGTRVTVQVILELLAAGETIDGLLSEYDELTRDDVLAALEYAASIAGGTKVLSLVA